MDDSKFVLLTLEVLPRHFPRALQNSGIQHWRVRENSWIHVLNTFQNGCNTRREIVKPRYPPLPCHGFGIRPVKRSRHGTRVTKVNDGYQGRIIFLSRDWTRRILLHCWTITGNHINQDPPCTQKPIYTPIVTHHMRS